MRAELANMAEKSELKATLSEKKKNSESTRPTVKAEPESLLNIAGPCGSPSWILPIQPVTPRRPTTGGEQTPYGAPVSYGPSPETQRYRPDTRRAPHSAQCRHDDPPGGIRRPPPSTTSSTSTGFNPSAGRQELGHLVTILDKDLFGHH